MSDTHDHLDEIVGPDWGVPAGDLVVHAGDVSVRGTAPEIERFVQTYGKLPHATKVFIAGNHDWLFERNPEYAEALVLQAGGTFVKPGQVAGDLTGLVYLQDSGCRVNGLLVWGSPWTPRFFDWAFQTDAGSRTRALWSRIPADVDILVTHGPAFGVMDQAPAFGVTGAPDRRVGCQDLAEELAGRTRLPRLHVFGHIHGQYGVQSGPMVSVNAALLNDRYNVTRAPVVVDL
jgi:hypothetical protein